LTLAETEDRDQLLSPEQKKEAKRQRREYADSLWENRKSDYHSLNLKELEERFERIFRRSIFALDLEHVTFHFLEEVGEVAEALTRLYTYKVKKDTPPETLSKEWRSRLPDLEDELADSFSWLFAVSSKFRDIFKMFDGFSRNTKFAERMYIAEHLKKRHMRESDSVMKCYDCGADHCACSIKLVTDDDSAQKLTQGG
jgi:NTP pyrophosphatase (non-canonical NTP hydrolase)